VLPQRQCTDPVRGQFSDRFESVVLNGVTLEEIAKKLRVQIQIETPIVKTRSAGEILAEQKSYLEQP